MSDYQFNPNVEQWKEIPGFLGYEVSDQGRVRSYMTQGRKGGCHPIPQRFLKPWGKNTNHQQVSLCNLGKERSMYISRLVLLAFIGPCPFNQEACHNDGNPFNNFLPNLRWDTRKANIQDSIKHGTFARGIHSGMAKLNDDMVKEIRHLYTNGAKTIDLSKRYGVTRSNIFSIVLMQTWRHVI